MKFVSISGGLGNQMFIYAFCLELRRKGYHAVIYKPVDDHADIYGHQGYELERIFTNIDASDIKNKDNLFFRMINRFPIKWKNVFWKLFSNHVVRVPENFIFYPSVFNNNHKTELFKGTWQSEKYFIDAQKDVLNHFKFNIGLISDKTRSIASTMKQQNAVSLHIRRGDYFSNAYSAGFANVCTLEYYQNAINYISAKIRDAVFYVFSDDMEWVQSNLNISDSCFFVDWNRGSDSWQDMYLMSCCKHNIIANSSFSWWGAYLNSNPDKIVIAPKKWWRLFKEDQIDDVVPDNWIRL